MRGRWIAVGALAASMGWFDAALAEGYGFHSRVKVAVSCKTCESQVRSYLTRELRKLSDVSVVETDEDYEMSIVVTPTSSQGGRFTGYAMSIVFVDHALVRVVADSVHDLAWNCPDKNRDLIRKRAKGGAESAITTIESLDNIVHHSVQSLPPEDLESTCAEIVATLDAKHIERDRRAYQEVMDMQRQKSSPKVK